MPKHYKARFILFAITLTGVRRCTSSPYSSSLSALTHPLLDTVFSHLSPSASLLSPFIPHSTGNLFDVIHRSERRSGYAPFCLCRSPLYDFVSLSYNVTRPLPLQVLIGTIKIINHKKYCPVICPRIGDSLHRYDIISPTIQISALSRCAHRRSFRRFSWGCLEYQFELIFSSIVLYEKT